MTNMLVVLTGLFLWMGVGNSATFYVDPAGGSDADGDGSVYKPWQSIAKTIDIRADQPGLGKAAAYEDITFILSSGNYGELTLSDNTGLAKTSGTNTTYKAAPGAEAVFSQINMTYSSQTGVNMTFEGITVFSPRPEESGGLAKAAALTPKDPVYLDGASNITFTNCKISSPSRYGGPYLIHLLNCRDILIEKCEVTEGKRCVQLADCQRVKLRYNHLHGTTNSSINYLPGNTDCVIEGNHIHDQVTWESSHASAIALRTGDVIIRNNIIHDGYNSSGMMLYNDDGPTVYYFSNVLFENNLMYDITNVYCLRLHNIVRNVVVRNNTFIGKKNEKNDGRYCMNTAITGGSPELSVYNNVFVGAAYISGSIGHNIMWSCSSDAWQCTLGSNIIKTCSYGVRPFGYFTDGFFAQTPDFTPNHGRIIDYSLAGESPAINFGDPAQQPATSLGTLGADGFIIDNGPARDVDHHSAGCYEFTTTYILKDEYPITNVQFPISNERVGQRMYDLTGKPVPANPQRTGLYLVREGNCPKKVMLVK